VFVWGVRVCVCVWVLERVCACASVGRTFSQVMIKKFFFLSHRHWHEHSKRHRSSMFGGPWRKRERGSPDSSRGEHRFARRRCASFGMAFFMALTLLEAADSNLPVTRSNLIERTSAVGQRAERGRGGECKRGVVRVRGRFPALCRLCVSARGVRNSES